jgi:hypothetical protein
LNRSRLKLSEKIPPPLKNTLVLILPFCFRTYQTRQ